MVLVLQDAVKETLPARHTTACRTQCEMNMQDCLIQSKHSQMVTAEREPLLKSQRPQNPAALPCSSLLSKSVILDAKTHQHAKTPLDHDQVSSAISFLDLVPPRTAEAY